MVNSEKQIEGFSVWSRKLEELVYRTLQWTCNAKPNKAETLTSPPSLKLRYY